MLQDIGQAVAACVKARRFQDLKAAVTEYGTVLGLGPAFLLNTVIFRQLAAYAHRLTSPQEAATFAEYVLVAEALTRANITLDQAIEMYQAVATLADTGCSNAMIDAFFTIETPPARRIS